MKYAIHIAGVKETFYCNENDSILTGLLKAGSRGIQVGCRGGGCGVCKIQILSGDYVARPMAKCHVSDDDLEQGRVLACQVFPRSDIHLEVLGKLARRFDKAA
tara:strand:- start:265 stop:573 length:309 start_codon:yes stop_codon:yes gene_type:complete